MECNNTINKKLKWIESYEDTELAELSRALGNAIRVRILKMLIAKNSCVCHEIVNELPISQSTVSQHLKVLKKAGLVKGIIKGQSVCYCADHEVLKKLKLLIVGL